MRIVALLVWLGCVGCARDQEAPLSDVGHALALLRRAGLAADSASIQRVLRDSDETVVWVVPRVKGLPVFHRQVGYLFDQNGKREVDRTTGRPMMLGEALPDESAVPNPEPRITADSAKAAYLGQAQQERGPGRAAPSTADAVLGYASGTSSDQLRLVWRVSPPGQEFPMALIDARDGGVLFFDSGIRCARAPCP